MTHHLIPAIIRQIKTKAMELNASDVFLVSGCFPQCRIDGRTITMKDFPRLSEELLEEFLDKVISAKEMEIFKNNMELDFALDVPDLSRFRVNAFWQIRGISISMRFVPKEIPEFASLNLPESLQKILTYKSGLVLLTGPMGSGKSTTLAALLDLINKNQHRHIITIEDPIEFLYANDKSFIEQREVGVHTQNFQNALRSCLRQSADIILLGEMRDLETITLALTAAETGALVLTTAHTNGSSKVVNRISDVFPGNQQEQIRQQLAEVLRCIVWQNLIPLKNTSGRVAAFEVMFQNYAVMNLIRENRSFQLDSIIESGGNEGMISMKKSLKHLLLNDQITVEEASMIVPEATNEFIQQATAVNPV